ncbi:MAG: MarR family transcriptional regulator [Sinobacteraceae bacterium]|nr:MarR family transcriptional regulator [Nevskiaceae bacterium]
MDKALRKMQLDLASWRALMLLHEQNPSSVSEIAARAVMRLSTMTRVVQRLEKRGMARLERRASDARVTEVFISDAGERAVTEIRNLASSIYAVAFRNVSSTEIATLNRILGKVCANLQLLPSGH